MTDRIKVGVAGVGSLGQHHARVYTQLPDAELVGVYDASPERAKEIADRHSVRAFASLEEMAGAVQAASIVVPTDLHHQVATTLMPRGLHLLVEKPIAATPEEAADIVRCAKAHDVTLQVGHIERFNPVITFLQQRLPQPRFIEATRLCPYPPGRPGAPPRGTEVSVVLDMMIHDLDVVLQLVKSPVKEVHAIGVPVLSPTEDICNARLLFANGCVANLSASRISRDRLRKIRVFEKDSYLSLDYMNQCGMLHHKEGDRIVMKEVPIEKREPLFSELESFIDSVRHRKDPVVTGDHGTEAVALAMEITRCMRDCPS